MPTVDKRTTVLVVDHNPIFLNGIQSLIRNEVGLYLVGAVVNPTEAWTLFLSTSPHIVLIDLDLPDTSALRIIQNMKNARRDVCIIGTATYEFDPIGNMALANGAQVILSKERISEDLVRVIRQVCASEMTSKHADDSEMLE
jgi:DNA-binding NarL/FixJ family response regulator